MNWQLFASVSLLSITLAACGGGDGESNDSAGGGSGSNSTAPSSPTRTLSNSDAEASTLAQSTVKGSSDNVTASRRQNQLNGFAKVAGATTAASSNASTAQSIKAITMMSARFAGKESVEVTCAEITSGSSGEPADEQIRDCSGSVSFDTNIDDSSIDSSGAIAAGTFVNMTFNSLSYTTTADGPVSVNGTIRVDYVERFVSNPPSGKLRYQAINLSSTSAGESFGPENLEYIISFDGNGVEVIADGVRLIGFDASYTDANNYTITDGSVIDQIGDDYVQVDYSNWRVVDDIPQTGSRLTVIGTNGTATVDVLSNDGTIVSMRITINADGNTTDYDLQINITNGNVTIV